MEALLSQLADEKTDITAPRTMPKAETAREPSQQTPESSTSPSLGPESGFPMEFSPSSNRSIIQKGKLSPRGDEWL